MPAQVPEDITVSLFTLCIMYMFSHPLLLQPLSPGPLQTWALGDAQLFPCSGDAPLVSLGQRLQCTRQRQRPRRANPLRQAWPVHLPRKRPGDFGEAERGVYGLNSSAELQCNEGARVNYPSVCVSAALNYRIRC